MRVTTEDFEHLYRKLDEVLGPRAAVTLMELLAMGNAEAAHHWEAMQARR